MAPDPHGERVADQRGIGVAEVEQVIRRYLDHALRRARYTPLEDGSYCAEVDGLRGVVATGSTVEACRKALEDVVEEWVLVRVARGLRIPPLDGMVVRIRRAA